MEHRAWGNPMSQALTPPQTLAHLSLSSTPDSEPASALYVPLYQNMFPGKAFRNLFLLNYKLSLLMLH